MESEVQRLRQQLEEEQRRREEAERFGQEEQRRREAAERVAQDEQRRREEAERFGQEEQKRREEEQKRREEEQKRREEAETRYAQDTGPTTLPEYLDACHVHLFSALTIQTNPSRSTQGDPANAENKVRPDKIVPWADFDGKQRAIWRALMNSDFIHEAHFTSRHTLAENGDLVRRRHMSSELDLNQFARSVVHDPVSLVIEQLYADRRLRTHFNLKGTIQFENHGNMLSPDRGLEGMQSLDLSGRRRSPRLQNRRDNGDGSNADRQGSTSPTSYAARPRPDEFCVCNIPKRRGQAEQSVATLIVENKAPHKLTLGHIYEGLIEMELDQVVEVDGKGESVAIRCRRLVAAVITQAFSYMIRLGLEYGYVYTGEAFIFLRVPDDPTVVFYHLSVPAGDVGPETGWSSGNQEQNVLHLTAVGQALAFTLRALRTRPRGASWISNALRRLKKWNVSLNDIEEAIPEEDAPSSEYRPPNWRHIDIDQRSPIQFRHARRPRSRASCDLDAPASAVSGDSDDPDDPYTPSRSHEPLPTSSTLTAWPGSSHRRRAEEFEGRGSTRQRDLGPFCTSDCLLGMRNGGPLDPRCPNVHAHGSGSHAIDHRAFLRGVRRVLRGQLENCESMNVNGARGALFKIRLPGFGYTIAAKGTGVECVQDLKHESAVYRHLRPLQGRYIPVYLGEAAVQDQLYYFGAVRIVYMLLLSFEGWPLSSSIPRALADQALFGLENIHAMGVLQNDAECRNILYHPDQQRIIWHDFDRAKIDRRRILGDLSPNRKRKIPVAGAEEKLPKAQRDTTATREWNHARSELYRHVKKPLDQEGNTKRQQPA